MSCPLCELCEGKIITKLYYQDDKVIVVDCSTHLKPMIVLRRHTAYPTQEEMRYLKEIAVRLFPEMSFRGPASIRDHFHWHAI